MSTEVALQSFEKSILELEGVLRSHNMQVRPEIMHHFAQGTYCRTMLGKAGDCIVGATHRKDHITIVSSGKALVVWEGGQEEIAAPAVIKSEAGVRRAFYVLEDITWTTVHENPTNTHDVKQLEHELVEEELP